MLNMFNALPPAKGREIIKKVGILITPNLRIVDAISFDSIMSEMKMKIPKILGIEHITTSTYYSKEIGALATWDFLAIGSDGEGCSTARGNVVIKRVQDVKIPDTTRDLQEQVAYMHDVALSKEKI